MRPSPSHPPQPVSIFWTTPNLSPSFLLTQAIFEPNLFLYKYSNFTQIQSYFIPTCLWRWNSVFRSISIQNSDAGELPRRKHTIVLFALCGYFVVPDKSYLNIPAPTICCRAFLPKWSDFQQVFPGQDTRTYGRILLPPAKEIWQT